MASERRSEGRKAILLGSGLIVTTLLALCPGVLRGETLFLRDLSLFHRPLRKLLLDLTAASEGIPNWNPHANFGQPFAANPNSGVFDPFSALFLVLPFDLAFNLQVLLPLLIGAAGFAWLVRVRKGSKLAAAFGALTWGLGGCALSVSGYLQMHHAVCWLPLTLALAQRYVQYPTRPRLAWLCLPLGAIGLAGSPTGIMLTAMLLPFAAWEVWSRRPDRKDFETRFGVSTGFILASVFGGMIATVTLVPAVRLARDTARVADEGFVEEAKGWSLPPVRVLELAAPRAFGHVEPETVGFYWGRELYGWRQWPYLFSLYGGLAALVLSFTALAARAKGDGPWLLAGGLGLVLAFGAHWPFWDRLADAIPLLSFVRFPEKWAVAPALVMALFAARGLDLVRRDERALRRARLLALTLAVLLSAVALTVVLREPGAWFWSVPDWLQAEVLARARRDCGLQVVIAGLLVAAVFVQRMRGLTLPLLLIALTAFDLAFAGRSLLPTRDPAHYDVPPAQLAPLLQAPEAERRLFLYADWKGADLRRDGMQVPLEAPAPWQWGIGTVFEKDFDGTQLSWTRAATMELLELMAEDPELAGRVLERRSVRAVLPTPKQAPGLLATRSPMPLAFAASRAVIRAEDESLRAATKRGRGALVLEPSVDVPLTLSSAEIELLDPSVDYSGTFAAAELELLEWSPERIRLRVDASGEALIAVNATWHLRWDAQSQGRVRLVHLADGHLMAVVLPAGEHELLLEYEDWDSWLMVVMSLLGLCIAFYWVWRRPRWDAGEPRVPMAE